MRNLRVVALCIALSSLGGCANLIGTLVGASIMHPIAGLGTMGSTMASTYIGANVTYQIDQTLKQEENNGKKKANDVVSE